MSSEFSKKEKISIVPDVSLFAKLGSSNYTVSEAISELIDNSIDARDDKVTIKIQISKNEVIIEDDGRGMDKETAINSIVLGKSSKKTGELGHFGMGMKTSCMSLGTKFSIHTTTKGSEERYSIDFDAEEWEKANKWDQQITISSGAKKDDSGTKIHITNLKFNLHKNLVASLLDHLAERFGVFINNKEASIHINNATVVPSEQKLVDNSRNDFVIELNNGQKITGWTGLLEKGSQEKSGFNLYRYKRLIRPHHKLGYQYHPSKMWVTGEIHLDPIPVTHNKREFITTDPLYDEFFEKFKDILKKIIDESQNKNREEKIRDLPKNVKETLKDNLMKALNNFDELKEFAFPGENQLKRNPDGSELPKEKRDIAGDLPESETKDDSMKDQKRTPNKVSSNRAKFITINGQKYRFEFEWANLDDEEKSKEAYLDPSTNTIMVLLNSKYKLLDVVPADILYVIFYLSEGIIEVFLRESNQSYEKLVHLRDGIIKRLADVYSDDLEIKIKEKDENEVEAYHHLVSTKNQDDALLNDNEKACLRMRLEQGMSFQEISEHFKFTRQRAQQIFESALYKISNKNKPRTRTALDQKTEILELKKLKKEKQAVEIKEIFSNISNAYGVSIKEILSKSRKEEMVVPRHIIMHKLRSELGISFPNIGKIFNRDHTTVIHAVNKINNMLNTVE